MISLTCHAAELNFNLPKKSGIIPIAEELTVQEKVKNEISRLTTPHGGLPATGSSEDPLTPPQDQDLILVDLNFNPIQKQELENTVLSDSRLKVDTSKTKTSMAQKSGSGKFKDQKLSTDITKKNDSVEQESPAADANHAAFAAITASKSTQVISTKDFKKFIH